jgi:hypothetical protein
VARRSRIETASSAKTRAVVACSGASTRRTPVGSGAMSWRREGYEDQRVVFGLMSSLLATDLVLMGVPSPTTFPIPSSPGQVGGDKEATCG